MKHLHTIFEKAGWAVNSGDLRDAGTKVVLYSIKNPDGSLRWVWPAHTTKPLFLKFYNISSVKAVVFAGMIRLIFRLKLQTVFFSKHILQVGPARSGGVVPINKAWALFTGTPGPNRKAIFFINDEAQSSFVKVPVTSEARALIDNEGAVLNRLSRVNNEGFKVPRLIHANQEILQQEDISNEGIRTTILSETHLQALEALADCSKQVLPLNELPVWKEINKILTDPSLSQDERIPKGMLRKIGRIAAAMESDELIDTSMAHGDFTSWNMFLKDKKLNLYDWELSRENMPLGFDAFHFVIQQGILSERKGWKAIREDLEGTFELCRYTLFNGARHSIEYYLKLYLVINTAMYLDIYRRQAQWHEQIDWLLRTWNEALSDVAFSVEDARSLVICDALDQLQSRRYAVLKLSHENPEKISRFSDIDLCLTKEIARSFTRKLIQHPLVVKSVTRKRSYMSNLQLVLKDGSILSIDCVWRFKRRELEYMDLEEVLQEVVVNKFGVKHASPAMEARFIGLFYGLNYASVPEKYHHYQWTLMDKTARLDQILCEYYEHPEPTRPALIAEVKRLKPNRWLNRGKNWFVYLTDGLFSLVQRGGMVVTFSGVDGAGKSTVIDNVKLILEKKLRKRVVVIRHRPSIFPILSAWTKGKARAEEEAARSLPRQGSNTSGASSLLRFAYYYTDYLLGQFVVYLKHVLRGHVVLYDRYYFDFINDGKRSNIQLSEKLTRFGYRFLLKPDFNFFLYADPAIILKRKQELQSSTIKELTGKYLDLFASMNSNSACNSYIPIENVQLGSTVQQVMNRLMQKAA